MSITSEVLFKWFGVKDFIYIEKRCEHENINTDIMFCVESYFIVSVH